MQAPQRARLASPAIRTSLALAALLAACHAPRGASAATNLVQNGSFEDPVVPGAGYLRIKDTPIADWTLTVGDNVFLFDKNYTSVSGATLTTHPAEAGNQSVSFEDVADGSGAPGTLSQTLATVAGHAYTLTFGLYGLQSNAASILAHLGTATQAFTTVQGDTGYVVETLSYTATGASTVLSFTDAGPAGSGEPPTGGGEPTIDAVYVADDGAPLTPTPVPGTGTDTGTGGAATPEAPAGLLLAAGAIPLAALAAWRRRRSGAGR